MSEALTQDGSPTLPTTPWYVDAMQRGLLPDALVRFGIRQKLAQRLAHEQRGTTEEQRQRIQTLVQRLRSSQVAIHTDSANSQHYEVPAEFFTKVLGSHHKYSCALWEPDVTTLDEAERRMLDLYCQRAQLEDRQNVLDLGCGWGSFSLYAAPRYPESKFIAVSNSHSQREFIESRARELGIRNLEVRTADVNQFDPGRKFDRIVSVEMLEHMRNYDQLFSRISSWLTNDGRFFVHIFTHRETPYLFETEGGDEWMAQNFFTGGIMPSDHLFYHFQDDLVVYDHWRVNGTHYEKTSNAWLANMDQRRSEIDPVLEATYGPARVSVWRTNWRLFFLACAELWGYRGGNEWMVSHYLFRPRL